MMNFNRLGVTPGMLVWALTIFAASFPVSLWYHQVNSEISKIPELVEEVRKIPALVERVDDLTEEVSSLKEQVADLTEIMRRFIGRFDTLPADQQAALLNTILPEALELGGEL